VARRCRLQALRNSPSDAALLEPAGDQPSTSQLLPATRSAAAGLRLSRPAVRLSGVQGARLRPAVPMLMALPRALLVAARAALTAQLLSGSAPLVLRLSLPAGR